MKNHLNDNMRNPAGISAALERSERLLKITQQLGKIGIWEYDLESRSISWTDEVYTLYHRERSLGTPTPEEEAAYYSPEQASLLRQYMEEVSLTGREIAYDLTVNLPGGETGLYTAVMHPVKDPAGRVTALIGTIQDIGDRIITEKRLKESEMQYKTLFEEDLTGDFVATVTGEIRFCNRAFVSMFGFTEKENCGKTNIISLFHRKSDALEFLKRIRKEKQVVLHEQQMNKITGEEIFTIGNYSGIYNDRGELVEVKGYLFDITGRKLAEHRKELLTDILTILNRPNDWQHLIHDIVSRIKDFTGYETIGIRLHEGEDFPYYEKTGFPEGFNEERNSLCRRTISGELIRHSDGNPVLECMCGRVISGTIEATKAQFTTGGSFWTNRVSELIAQPGSSQEVLFPRGRCVKDGYESIALIPLRSGAEVIGLLQFNDRRADRFTLDLIEFFEELGNTIGLAFNRVLQEKRIRESEQQFRSLFENAPFPRWVYDLETLAFLDVNQAAISHYGYSRDEFLAMTLKDIRPKEEIQRLTENIAASNENVQSSGGWHHVKKDGMVIDVEVNSYAAIFGGRKSRVVLAQDVTARLQHERELQEMKTYLQKLLDHANAPIVALDTDLSVRGVNHAFEKLTGYSEREFEKLGFQILIPEPDRDRLEVLLAQFSSGKQWEHLEVPVITRSGEIRTIVWNSANIYGADGKTRVSTIVIGNDITNLKRIESELIQKEKLINQVVESLPVGVWLTDISGNIIRGNRAGQEIWKGARFVGPEDYGEYKGWWRSTGKQIQPEEWAAARAVRLGETSINEEIEIECFDGTEKIILNSAIPIRDDHDKITGAVVVNQDITERVKAEELVASVNKDLQRSKLLIEESDRLKTSLLNNLSHEFRTPMNAILGFSSIIESEAISTEITSMASRINHAGNRLMKTLGDIVDLSQIQSVIAGADLPLLHLSEVLEEMIPAFQDQAVKKGLEINYVCESGSSCRIDAGHFTQIIEHLLGNAIKFTDSGGIEVRLKLTSQKGKPWSELRISDTGIGIRPEHQQIIFEAFRQASEGYGRMHEGTGLGLAIVRAIVSIYGGTIKVESEQGKGSVFILSLPSTLTEEGEVVRAGHDQRRKSKMEPVPNKQIIQADKPAPRKILVVEDNENNIDLVRLYLGRSFSVTEAGTGEKALDLCNKQTFELVLMDINLGEGKDGMEVTREIRTMSAFKHVPIIAMTGYTASQDKERIFAAGCSHYLGKPFTKKQLIDLIGDVVK